MDNREESCKGCLYNGSGCGDGEPCGYRIPFEESEESEAEVRHAFYAEWEEYLCDFYD